MIVDVTKADAVTERLTRDRIRVALAKPQTPQAVAWTARRKRSASSLAQAIVAASHALEETVIERHKRDLRMRTWVLNDECFNAEHARQWSTIAFYPEHAATEIEQRGMHNWLRLPIAAILIVFIRRIRRYRSSRNAAWLDDLQVALDEGRDPLAIAHDLLKRGVRPMVGVHFSVAFAEPAAGVPLDNGRLGFNAATVKP